MAPVILHTQMCSVKMNTSSQYVSVLSLMEAIQLLSAPLNYLFSKFDQL